MGFPYHFVKRVQIRSSFWSVFSCIRTEYRKIRTRNNCIWTLFTQFMTQQYNEVIKGPTFITKAAILQEANTKLKIINKIIYI